MKKQKKSGKGGRRECNWVAEIGGRSALRRRSTGVGPANGVEPRRANANGRAPEAECHPRAREWAGAPAAGRGRVGAEGGVPSSGPRMGWSTGGQTGAGRQAPVAGGEYCFDYNTLFK
jgi:hypothetical protein